VAHRNYQPTLRNLSVILNKFITRYQTYLQAGMDSDQAAALATAAAALEHLISLLSTGGGV